MPVAALPSLAAMLSFPARAGNHFGPSRLGHDCAADPGVRPASLAGQPLTATGRHGPAVRWPIFDRGTDSVLPSGCARQAFAGEVDGRTDHRGADSDVAPLDRC